MLRLPLLLVALLTALTLAAQHDFYADRTFTHADSLRGSLRPERTAFDVTYYGLHLDLLPDTKSLRGYVDIGYQMVNPASRIQLDLYPNLQIDRIEQEGRPLDYTRELGAVFVDLGRTQGKNSIHRMRVHYRGKPTEAQNAPWDGGFVWKTDKKDRPWIGVACEGDGASLWWPNKDHLSDEPDSVLISVSVPDPLMVVANGNLRSQEKEGKGRTRYEWFVSYPINNYDVSINVANYVHFNDIYQAADGDTLALDYYVLDYNLDRARKQFRQVPGMLAAYEHYLGKYPFWDDGFALIETPYLGMEHQSGIAYGNQYMRGYLGGMIPPDMDWDYIIIHESGHEYFGNSIGVADLAEMWIHESFTTYLEALYVEHVYNAADARRYLAGQRPYIENKEPIIGPPGVNWDKQRQSSDHYFKGAWVLHTLRSAIGNDDLWFSILHDFYQDHQRSLIVSKDFFDYVARRTEQPWTAAFFEQYLYYPGIPTLQIRSSGSGKDREVRYRYQADVADFAMPIDLVVDRRTHRIKPTTTAWQTIKVGAGALGVAPDRFLVHLDMEED